jgi:hypothetical protein
MLVHVMSPVVPMAGDGYVSPKMHEEMAASNRAWAQKELNKLAAKAKTSGVQTKTAVLEGAARSLAHREAVPRHVAGRVVVAASCPVLTVRGK